MQRTRTKYGSDEVSKQFSNLIVKNNSPAEPKPYPYRDQPSSEKQYNRSRSSDNTRVVDQNGNYIRGDILTKTN